MATSEFRCRANRDGSRFRLPCAFRALYAIQGSSRVDRESNSYQDGNRSRDNVVYDLHRRHATLVVLQIRQCEYQPAAAHRSRTNKVSK